MLVNPERVKEAEIAYTATVLNMDISDASTPRAEVEVHTERAEQGNNGEENNDEEA